jgi:RNA polymerase sigma factor (sigma-70 family)
VQSPIYTELQLLTALAKGERKATEIIYRKHFPIVNGWLIKNGGSTNDGADLFQEAMVVLFGKAQEEDFRLTCSVGTYLFAVSKHLWYKKRSKQSRDPVFYDENIGSVEGLQGITYDDDISVHEEREMHYDQLNNALELIGEPCRSLLKAFYHDDKNMQEIAQSFGYTNPDNAKNQKYKCLTRLRKLFHDSGKNK